MAFRSHFHALNHHITSVEFYSMVFPCIPSNHLPPKNYQCFFLSIQMDFIQNPMEFVWNVSSKMDKFHIFPSDKTNSSSKIPLACPFFHWALMMVAGVQLQYPPTNRFTRHGKPTSLKTSMLWSKSSCLSKLSSPRGKGRLMFLFLFGWVKKTKKMANSTKDSRIYTFQRYI